MKQCNFVTNLSFKTSNLSIKLKLKDPNVKIKKNLET